MDKGEQSPKSYKHIPLHLCFDFKHKLRFKARLLTWIHMMEPPAEYNYSGVVYLESTHTAKFIVMHNDLCMDVELVFGFPVSPFFYEWLPWYCGVVVLKPQVVYLALLDSICLGSIHQWTCRTYRPWILGINLTHVRETTIGMVQSSTTTVSCTQELIRTDLTKYPIDRSLLLPHLLQNKQYTQGIGSRIWL